MSYWNGVEEPIPGRIDTDERMPRCSANTRASMDLATRAGSAVQPEHGAALRITELGEADLAALADGDVAFQLRAGDRDSHDLSLATGSTRLRTSSPTAELSPGPASPAGRRPAHGTHRFELGGHLEKHRLLGRGQQNPDRQALGGWWPAAAKSTPTR